MTAPPKWAQALTLQALLWWESQGHAAPLFTLVWRHSKWRLSSGKAYLPWLGCEPKVSITAGRNRVDQKLVLLHEVAHQLTNDRGHSPRFWDIAWSLYRWAKLPIRYCQKREYSYKVGAQVAYRRNRRANGSQ